MHCFRAHISVSICQAFPRAATLCAGACPNGGVLLSRPIIVFVFLFFEFTLRTWPLRQAERSRATRSAFGYADKGSCGGKWTPEEDDALKMGVEVLGPKKWLQISQDFLKHSRSAVQCLHRWQKVRNDITYACV